MRAGSYSTKKSLADKRFRVPTNETFLLSKRNGKKSNGKQQNVPYTMRILRRICHVMRSFLVPNHVLYFPIGSRTLTTIVFSLSFSLSTLFSHNYIILCDVYNTVWSIDSKGILSYDET